MARTRLSQHIPLPDGPGAIFRPVTNPGVMDIRRRDTRYPRILPEILGVERQEMRQAVNHHRRDETSIMAVLADHRRDVTAFPTRRISPASHRAAGTDRLASSVSASAAALPRPFTAVGRVHTTQNS